jgi:hypothetical protein
VFDAVATFFEQEGITQDPAKFTEADGSAIVQLCLPAPSVEALAELPVERLLDIRRRYATERRRFREKVQTQVAEIGDLPTPEAMHERMRAFRRDIQGDFEAAREAVKVAKVRERWGLVGITAAASLGAGVSLAAAASPIVASIEGVGSMALATTNWFVRKRAGCTRWSHYLESLDTSLKDPCCRLAGAFHDIANG